MVIMMLLVQVGSVETSPNNKMLAWTEDTIGNEKYTLYVKVRSRVTQLRRLGFAPWYSSIGCGL
jgi:protease II